MLTCLTLSVICHQADPRNTFEMRNHGRKRCKNCLPDAGKLLPKRKRCEILLLFLDSPKLFEQNCEIVICLMERNYFLFKTDQLLH